jgi:hypothetical protein
MTAQEAPDTALVYRHAGNTFMKDHLNIAGTWASLGGQLRPSTSRCHRPNVATFQMMTKSKA